MALAALFENLGGNVVGRAAQRRPPHDLHVLAGEEERSQTKVANLGVHVLVEEDVAHLEIAVDNALGVHVLDGTGNLDRVEADLWLRESLSSLDHVHQGAVGAQLQDQVGAALKGEGAVELDDVLVAHLGVDLQFGLELEKALGLGWPETLGVGAHLLLHLGRHLALDNLEGVALGGARELSIVADGKAALAEHLADLVDGALLAVRARGFDDIVGRGGRVLLVLGRFELSHCLSLQLVYSWCMLGIGIPRGEGPHLDAPGGHHSLPNTETSRRPGARGSRLRLSQGETKQVMGDGDGGGGEGTVRSRARWDCLLILGRLASLQIDKRPGGLKRGRILVDKRESGQKAEGRAGGGQQS